MFFSRVLVLSFLSPLLFPLLPSASDIQRHASGTEGRISTYSFPLQFERNMGQAAEGTAFIVHSRSGELGLDSRGSLVFGTKQRNEVKLSVLGAQPRPMVEAEEEQVTKRNYYYAAERQYTDVPSFGRVRYREIYPGIDLIYYGHDGHLEYDFQVAAGADPSTIRLMVTGAAAVKKVADGSLSVIADGRELRLSRPIAYQMIAGERRSISSRYVVRGNEIRMPLGTYDIRYPVVIDPTVVYSTYLNPPGVTGNLARDIAADSSGNTYLLALTSFSSSFGQPGFIIGPGSCTVTKLNAAGTGILYQTTVAVNGSCGFITAGPSGTIYFTGHGTIHPTAGVIQPLNKGTNNFVICLGAVGQISYATYLGGSGQDDLFSIAADSAGNLALVGQTTSNDFPLQNAFEGTLLTPFDGFLAVLNPIGSALNFSTYFNHARFDSVALDGAGNVFVTSLFSDPGVAVLNPLQPSCLPGAPGITSSCSMVAKFSPAGSLLFSTFLPADLSPIAINSISIDPTGQPYVAGQFNNGFMALVRVDPSGASMQRITIPDILATLVEVRTDAVGNVYIGGLQTVPTTSLQAGGQFVSVSPAGTVNFQFNAPGEVSAFAAGPAGHFYVAGSPIPSNAPLFYTVNPLQPAFAFSRTPDAFDVDDSYVADISAAPDASLGTNPGLVNFGDQGVTLSASSVVTLANLGSNPLTISSIAVSGADFSETNTCTAPLASGASCTVTISFVPSALGARSGRLTISSNATNAVQTVPLVGNGIPTPTPALTFSPTSLTFGSTPVGGFSSAQTVQLTNPGTAAVSFNRVDVSPDFQESNTCGTSLAIGASCTVSVIFHPTAAGSRSGTLTITDNVVGSPQTINLSGTGGSGFVLATPNGTTPSATVSAGQTANYTINLNSVLSFAGQVGFVCSGAPAGANCTVTPSSVQLAANASTPITIAVNTTARSSAAMHPVRLPWLGAAISAILFMFSMIFVDRPRSSLRRNRFALAVLTGVLLAMVGCGGGGSAPPSTMTSGTPAGTYTIMITGNSGTVTQSQAMVLKVN